MTETATRPGTSLAYATMQEPDQNAAAASRVLRAMRTLAIAAILSAACKSTTPIPPPPISDGKCLVDVYVGPTAESQTCVYVGYTWACSLSPTGWDQCKRGREASGERGK